MRRNIKNVNVDVDLEQLSTKLCHKFSPCARVKEEQAGHGDDDDEVKILDMENGHGEVQVKKFVIGDWLDGIWLPGSHGFSQWRRGGAQESKIV